MPSTLFGPRLFVMVSVYLGGVSTALWEISLPEIRAEELKKSEAVL